VFYQSTKQRNGASYCFSLHYAKSTILLDMAKNILFEEHCDGILCEAAESFENEA